MKHWEQEPTPRDRRADRIARHLWAVLRRSNDERWPLGEYREYVANYVVELLDAAGVQNVSAREFETLRYLAADEVQTIATLVAMMLPESEVER